MVFLVDENQFDKIFMFLIYVSEKIILYLNLEKCNLGFLMVCQKISNIGYALVVTKQKKSTNSDGGSNLYLL